MADLLSDQLITFNLELKWKQTKDLKQFFFNSFISTSHFEGVCFYSVLYSCPKHTCFADCSRRSSSGFCFSVFIWPLITRLSGEGRLQRCIHITSLLPSWGLMVKMMCLYWYVILVFKFYRVIHQYIIFPNSTRNAFEWDFICKQVLIKHTRLQKLIRYLIRDSTKKLWPK